MPPHLLLGFSSSVGGRPSGRHSSALRLAASSWPASSGDCESSLPSAAIDATGTGCCGAASCCCCCCVAQPEAESGTTKGLSPYGAAVSPLAPPAGKAPRPGLLLVRAGGRGGRASAPPASSCCVSCPLPASCAAAAPTAAPTAWRAAALLLPLAPSCPPSWAPSGSLTWRPKAGAAGPE